MILEAMDVRYVLFFLLLDGLSGCFSQIASKFRRSPEKWNFFQGCHLELRTLALNDRHHTRKPKIVCGYLDRTPWQPLGFWLSLSLLHSVGIGVAYECRSGGLQRCRTQTSLISPRRWRGCGGCYHTKRLRLQDRTTNGADRALLESPIRSSFILGIIQNTRTPARLVPSRLKREAPFLLCLPLLILFNTRLSFSLTASFSREHSLGDSPYPLIYCLSALPQ